MYTFFIDTNSLFCVISHIVSLICDDDVYTLSDMTLRTVLTLNIWESLYCQLISWKENIMNASVFHISSQIIKWSELSQKKTFSYSKYHKWVKHLEEKTDFVQILITYCLWQTTENVINSESCLSHTFFFQKALII